MLKNLRITRRIAILMGKYVVFLTSKKHPYIVSQKMCYIIFQGKLR